MFRVVVTVGLTLLLTQAALAQEYCEQGAPGGGDLWL